MERAAWTDERLDDFAQNVDARFDRVDHEIREFRQEMRAELGSVRGEVGSVRGELDALRNTMIRGGAWFGGGIMAGLLGVIATLIAQG